MDRKWMLSGAALAALIAIPLVAQAQMDGHGMDRTVKRADVEVMVKDMFARVDANKDGAITRDEIDAAREKRKAERRAGMFDALDANKDGSLSREEFAAGPGPRDREGHDGPPPAPGADRDAGPMGDRGMAHGPMRKMRGMGERMFAIADVDKDGKVTLAEATRAALAHFDQIDANKDGQVTPEERRAFHKKMHGG